MSRIFLVRHGEASWHSDDYDRLTDRGHAQARAVGEELVARRVVPDVVMSGTLRRHRETAAGLLAGAQWPLTVVEDTRWNELDADDIIRVHDPEHDTMTGALAHFAGRGAPQDFESFFDQAMDRWLGGDGGHVESFTQFVERVNAALDALVAGLAPQATAVVVTSGGVQNAIASQILGGGSDTWRRIFGMFPNTGLMRLTHGERGLRLRSLGELSHLERQPDLLSELIY